METNEQLVYGYDDDVSAEELFQLLDKMKAFTGDRFAAKDVFHIPLRNMEKERVSLKESISVTARDENGVLIGYLRILTDHAYISYILDVMVAPEWRKGGVGKRLVGLAVEKCKENGFIKIFLTCIPGTEGFYRRFGFNEGMSPVLTIRGEDYA